MININKMPILTKTHVQQNTLLTPISSPSGRAWRVFTHEVKDAHTDVCEAMHDDPNLKKGFDTIKKVAGYLAMVTGGLMVFYGSIALTVGGLSALLLTVGIYATFALASEAVIISIASYRAIGEFLNAREEAKTLRL